MNLVFVLLVVIGFLFHFLATIPVPPSWYPSRIAWFLWFMAALLWAVPQLHA